MASLQADAAQLSSEYRRNQRVKVDLLGRYMLEDRREFPCQVVDMSPGGMAVIAPQCGKPGERVVAYIDHVGRLEGRIARSYPSGFSMTIVATARKRDKLAAQLTWLANRSSLDLPDDRRHPRVIQHDQTTTVRMESGGEERCRIVDLSVSVVNYGPRTWPAGGPNPRQSPVASAWRVPPSVMTREPDSTQSA